MRRNRLSRVVSPLLLLMTIGLGVDALAAQSQQEKVVVPSAPRRGAAPNTTPQRAPSRSVTHVIPEGTILEVRLTEQLSSRRNVSDDEFEAILDRDLMVGQEVVAKKGSRVVGRLLDVKDSGRVKGVAKMSLELDEIYIEDEPYAVRTGRIDFQAEGSKKDDAKKIGIGAGIGAIIGGIFGGGKGAAIGAAAGGGATGAKVLVTKGEDIELQAEKLLSFRLERDVKIRNP